MRRLPEGAPELAAEVRGREPRSACERRHVELLSVARVDQVPGAEKVAGGWDGCDHRPSIAAAGQAVCEVSVSPAPAATAEGRPLLRGMPEQLALFEAAAGAEHDALERRVRDDDRQPGFRAQQPLEST